MSRSYCPLSGGRYYSQIHGQEYSTGYWVGTSFVCLQGQYKYQKRKGLSVENNLRYLP